MLESSANFAKSGDQLLWQLFKISTMPVRLKAVINNTGDTIRYWYYARLTTSLTFCHSIIMQFLGVSMFLPAVNLLVTPAHWYIALTISQIITLSWYKTYIFLNFVTYIYIYLCIQNRPWLIMSPYVWCEWPCSHLYNLCLQVIKVTAGSFTSHRTRYTSINPPSATGVHLVECRESAK